MRTIVHDMEQTAVLHLPKDVVNGVAQEALPVVRRQKFGPQYCHELLEVHLAVPCGTHRKKRQRFRRTQQNHTFTGLFPWTKRIETDQQTEAPGAVADSHSPLQQVLPTKSRVRFLQIEIQRTRLALCVYQALCCSTLPPIEINKHPVE